MEEGNGEKRPGEEITLVDLQSARAAKRICGDLQDLEEHIQAVKHKTGPVICEVCGKDTYTYCKICKKAVHFCPQKGSAGGKDGELCWTRLHSEHFYGLTRSDTATLHGKRKRDWRPPSKTKVQNNAKHISHLRRLLK